METGRRIADSSGGGAAGAVIVYAVVGALWVAASDWALEWASQGADSRVLQTAKGFLFIGATALVFYLLLARLRRDLVRADALEAASESRWRAFADTASDWFWETDTEHRFMAVSERFGETLDVSPATLLGRRRWELPGAEDRPPDWAAHRADLVARRPFRDLVHSLRGGDGRLRRIEARGAPHFVDGAFVGYRGASAEITEAEARQDELRTTQERILRTERMMRDAIDSLADGFAIFDAEDRLVLSNRTFGASHLDPRMAERGVAFEEIARRTADALIHPDDLKPDAQAWFEWRMARHRNPQGPFEVRFRDGAWARITENRTEEGGIVHVRADITAQKRNEAELGRASQRLADAIEAIPSGFVMFDADDRLVLWNSKYAELYGPHVDIVKAGRTLTELVRLQAERGIFPEAVGRIDEFVAEAMAWHRRSEEGREVQLADGRWLFMRERRTAYGGIVGIRMDVTEAKQREQQLSRAQKLDAVGQLTGGVAHDFNNLLTVILGNLDLVDEDLAADSRARAHLRGAISAAERGAALTQRLLAFARRLPLRAEPTAVNDLVSGMGELLARTLGEDIEIKLALDPAAPRAFADPSQLENALVNLALNARDAMPGGGRLTIETGEATLDEDYASRHAEVRAGRYVLLGVGDTGHGMTPEVLDRAIEPFFTTKGAGKGTGLGLSMVFGFAKQSGGHLRIYSEPGHGTSVRLYLPIAAGEAAPAPVAAGPATGGAEVILVVEDDAGVRELVILMLETLGYRVLAAPDGPSALALLEATPEIDLLFTDVVLPKRMSGRELAERAALLRPGLKVLFTSGYTENAIVHHGRLDEGVLLLSKPYQKAELARKVREALDD